MAGNNQDHPWGPLFFGQPLPAYGNPLTQSTDQAKPMTTPYRTEAHSSLSERLHEKLEERRRALDEARRELEATERAIRMIEELTESGVRTEPGTLNGTPYPRGATALARVNYILERIGRFAHKSEIEEMMRQNEPDAQNLEHKVSTYLSKAYRDNQLERVTFNRSRHHYFYGLINWVGVDNDRYGEKKKKIVEGRDPDGIFMDGADPSTMRFA